MFCGMTFTTTGIEFGRSKPIIVRVGPPKLMTVSVPSTEKQSAFQGLADKEATKTQETSQPVSRAETSKAGQDSQKKTSNAISVEDPSSLSSSFLGPPYPLRPFPSSLSPTEPDRRSANASKGKLYATTNARSGLSSSSSLPIGINSRLSNPHNKSVGKAASGVQFTPEKSSPSENSKLDRHFSDTQPVKRKATKGPPKKGVRFAMDVQENHKALEPSPLSDASSSDDSDCSYIDPPPMVDLERSRSRPSKPSDTLERHPYRLVPVTTGHRSSRDSAGSPVAGAFTRSTGQSTASKGHARVRPLDPVVLVYPDQEEVEGRDRLSQSPTVIKPILKDTSAKYHATPLDDDKENNLQYNERLGLAFRDV